MEGNDNHGFIGATSAFIFHKLLFKNQKTTQLPQQA